MNETFLLNATILLLVLGAGLLWVVAPAGRDAVRYTALLCVCLTLIFAGSGSETISSG